MLERLMDFVVLCMLLFYSLTNYIYDQIRIRVITKPKIPTPIMSEEMPAEEEEEEMAAEEEEFEFFQNNATNQENNSTTSTTDKPLKIYNPNDYWSYNAGKYNEYSIEQIYPKTLLLPHNYHLQTEDYEKENTDYDYNDFNNVDGSGVHLLGNWPKNNINTPWFETCLSPMGCSVVEGTLEKFNYT